MTIDLQRHPLTDDQKNAMSSWDIERGEYLAELDFCHRVGKALDVWLDEYGRVLSFEAKQALIPVRDALWSDEIALGELR